MQRDDTSYVLNLIVKYNDVHQGELFDSSYDDDTKNLKSIS